MNGPQVTYPPLQQGRSYRMSYEEYLELIPEYWQAEWADGEVYIFMPPKPRHQFVSQFIAVLLEFFVGFFRLGKLLVAPVEMVARPGGPSRQPDILFIANENVSRITETRIEGPADLIIEFISDESVTRDTKVKLKEYEVAGVREYWTIDARPRRQRARFWVLNPSGHYEEVVVGADGIYRSAVIAGFWFRPEWLFRDELPQPFETFAEIVGFPPQLVEQLRQSITPTPPTQDE